MRIWKFIEDEWNDIPNLQESQKSDLQDNGIQEMSDSLIGEEGHDQQAQFQNDRVLQAEEQLKSTSSFDQSSTLEMSDDFPVEESCEHQAQFQNDRVLQAGGQLQSISSFDQSSTQEMSDSPFEKEENCIIDFSFKEVRKIEKISEENESDHKLTAEQKKELYEKLKKSIEEIRKRIAKKIKQDAINNRNQEIEMSKEEAYELSEHTNHFFEQLDELPSFEDRDRGLGYAIDTESNTEIPESVIRTLITKFLNQRFCRDNTDLNVRSNSLDKTHGFYKWEIRDVIIHLQTHQITKVLTDKYGYQYAQGKNENVPLSFYFDMSGSMSKYTNMLAVIAIELLKKDVKVLIGFNEMVNAQIESIEKNLSVKELALILESLGYWNGFENRFYDEDCQRYAGIKLAYIGRNIDDYLIDKKAEKCVVFADFDPIYEVINLSQVVDVYWFCFESSYNLDDIDHFNGFIYKVQNLRDLEQGLLKVNEKRFETLCYVDNPKNIQRKVRMKK